jgi:protein-tyrosine-phosphatase
VRWRVLAELARSDRQVQELTAKLRKPQSLVSYHLGRLRAGELVSMRRSSADARGAFYRLELARCRELLAASGGTLHPGLALVPPSAYNAVAEGRRARVLFLCTANSSRSQMAEALMKHAGGDSVEVHSAGSRPAHVHAEAVRAMRERGIDISAATSKPLTQFVRRRFDHVVTLCDRVREVCPEFPGGAERMHWSVADPALDSGAGGGSYEAFRRAAAEIEIRVEFMLHIIRQDTRR